MAVPKPYFETRKVLEISWIRSTSYLYRRDPAPTLPFPAQILQTNKLVGAGGGEPHEVALGGF